MISENPKGYQESKLKINNTYQRKDIKSMNFKLPKVLLRPLVEIKMSLTQKDTMDRGALTKTQKERNRGGLKRTKVQKHQKNAKWHGNEEQTNIFVHHLLQSCGV